MEHIQEGEFTEVEAQPEAQPQQEEGVRLAKGIVLGLAEDGRLVHEFIGSQDANIIEMEGLLEYGHRVLEKKWDSIL